MSRPGPGAPVAQARLYPSGDHTTWVQIGFSPWVSAYGHHARAQKKNRGSGWKGGPMNLWLGSDSTGSPNSSTDATRYMAKAPREERAVPCLLMAVFDPAGRSSVAGRAAEYQGTDAGWIRSGGRVSHQWPSDFRATLGGCSLRYCVSSSGGTRYRRIPPTLTGRTGTALKSAAHGPSALGSTTTLATSRCPRKARTWFWNPGSFLSDRNVATMAHRWYSAGMAQACTYPPAIGNAMSVSACHSIECPLLPKGMTNVLRSGTRYRRYSCVAKKGGVS